jgi:Spy/CpxP family protein refolding chaperone
MMNIESKGKWQIRLATLSIFLLGFVAGAIALNAYHLWFGGANSNRMSKQERFEEAFNSLEMNETQKVEVQQILGETREKVQRSRQELDPKMQQIRAETDEKLQRVLTPEQWAQFQQEREKILSRKSKSSSKEINLK